MIRSKTKLHSRVVKAVTVGDVAQLSPTLRHGAQWLRKTVAVRRKQSSPAPAADSGWKLIVGDPNGRE
jgi:hypothetical protein